MTGSISTVMSHTPESPLRYARISPASMGSARVPRRPGAGAGSTVRGRDIAVIVRLSRFPTRRQSLPLFPHESTCATSATQAGDSTWNSTRRTKGPVQSGLGDTLRRTPRRESPEQHDDNVHALAPTGDPRAAAVRATGSPRSSPRRASASRASAPGDGAAFESCAWV